MNDNEFDDIIKVGEIAVSNYHESIDFVRNYPAKDIDEEMKFALVADTLELFNGTVIDASNMVALIAQICAMCTPTEMLSEFLDYMADNGEKKELDQISQVLELISVYIEMFNGALGNPDDD
jgi:hypothetical protein